jgi:predicted nucleotidyltransferase
MYKLRRIDIERSEEIFSRIMDYCGIVVERLRPDAVILFGSLARGDFNEGSDVDILVVADFREPFLDRIKVLLDLNDRTRLPLEPVGYTAEEFMEMLERKNSFILEAVEKGKILYVSERTQIYRVLKNFMRDNVRLTT